MKVVIYECDFCNKRVESPELTYNDMPKGWAGIQLATGAGSYGNKYLMCDNCCTDIGLVPPAKEKAPSKAAFTDKVRLLNKVAT